MDSSNPMLWLAWTSFAGLLVFVLTKRYLPAIRQAPPPPLTEPVRAPAAWLFCEEGTALDRRVRWFELRPGGRTMVGSRPRAATQDTSFVYLTAEDIQEDHVLISFDAGAGRYAAEAVGPGEVLHNNEELPAGERAELTDGDTLDLGRVSRFRYTLTGPEGA